MPTSSYAGWRTGFSCFISFSPPNRGKRKGEMGVLEKKVGSASTRGFQRSLTLHRTRVRKIFTSVFHGKGTPHQARSGHGVRMIESGWFRKIGWLHPGEAA